MIIITVGPSCRDSEVISNMKVAGANCFRINLSHSDENDLCFYWDLLTKENIVPALDTQGAQMRFLMKEKENFFEKDEFAYIYFDHENFLKSKEKKVFFCSTKSIFQQLKNGMQIRCDFGALLLKVVDKYNSYKKVKVLITRQGHFVSNRAVDIIKSQIKLPPITDYDKFAIDYAIKKGLKKIFLSFASSSREIKEMKSLAPNAEIIAKIESRAGLENIDSIIEASDGILIDRGDLSREISIGLVPFAVETILDASVRKSKPCYIATNVLDSMISNDIPSRAEISDMWNLLSKGASGFVLAAEAAIGKNPINSVHVVRHIQKLHKLSKHGFVSLINTNILNDQLPEGGLKNWL